MKKPAKVTLAIVVPVVFVLVLAFWNINNPNYNPAELSGMLTGTFFLCAIFAVLAYIAQQSSRNARNDRPVTPSLPRKSESRSFDPIPKDFMPRDRK